MTDPLGHSSASSPEPGGEGQGEPPRAEAPHAADSVDQRSTGEHPRAVGQPSNHAAGAPPKLPNSFGRYVVSAMLGAGGFGVVYRGYDSELKRDVAIKASRADAIAAPAEAEAFLAEARVLASLDHPGIVPVFDAGCTADGRCYVVSKLIPGSDLARAINVSRPPLDDAIDLIVQIAEALHYAHGRGIVHRNMKPSNILVDQQGRALVADFSLTLRDDAYSRDPMVSSAPAYMSPEQARGEDHRVDTRSDVYSLGVVFYELLTGRLPYRDSSAPEVLQEITAGDLCPPRQLDHAIPKELERICLKALARRMSDRYATAFDLAEDLRQWSGPRGSRMTAGPDSDVNRPAPASATPQPLAAGPIAPQSDSARSVPQSVAPAKVVLKGLRSFDSHDADFFLHLLPGPTDRDGLPESLRFWQDRVEQTDGDRTFAVGLIYGPSGCGKSSLMKAGLLPRLATHVHAVYLEATADETEHCLQRALQEAWDACQVALAQSNLADSPPATLPELVAAFRRGQGLPAGHKILIVLDQFEQWLHANRNDEEADLIRALRHCDGGRVQCMVIIRDDFWMAAARFFRELEAPLLEGVNSAAVDLFDMRHARRALALFGKALGRIPEEGALAPEQEQFLDQALAGLAEEGKVVAVRLALFAEMVKGQPWTPATLRSIGGIAGLGSTFLEQTFSAPTAPPQHRIHQQAACAVLAALLPDVGTDIKGRARSEAELLSASGYSHRPADFAKLLHVLDDELTLITPTVENVARGEEPVEGGGRRVAGNARDGSEALQAVDGSAVDGDVLNGDQDISPTHPATPSSPATTSFPSIRSFQLTHDFLVPALRDWLTRKQRETRRGRAELRLTDLSAAWNVGNSSRVLPDAWEWISILLSTQRTGWTQPQRRMMRASARRQLTRLGTIASVLIVAGAGVALWRSRLADQRYREAAAALVERLLVAETTQVPAILKDLAPLRRWTDSDLREMAAGGKLSDKARLHVGMALIDVDPEQVDVLQTRMVATTDPDELAVIRNELENRRPGVALEDLWRAAVDPAPGHRLQASCALAAFDPANEKWAKVAPEIAADLIDQHAQLLPRWMELLKPVRKELIPPLEVMFRDLDISAERRVTAATVLVDYAHDDPRRLAELALDANPRQFDLVLKTLEGAAAESPSGGSQSSETSLRDVAIARFTDEAALRPDPDWADPPLDPSWARPSADIRSTIENADGLLTERFAMCQTLSLDQWEGLAAALSKSGYRPINFRPYAARDNATPTMPAPVRVAACWTRDGGAWRAASNRTAPEIQALDVQLRKEGLAPLDVAGYQPDAEVGSAATLAKERYAVLWGPAEKDAEYRIVLGLTDAELQVALKNAPPGAQASKSVLRWLDGVWRTSGVYDKRTTRPSNEVSALPDFGLQLGPDYDWATAMTPFQSDVRLTARPVLETQSDNYRAAIADADKVLEQTPDDANSLYTRAEAHYNLGEYDGALTDVTAYLAKVPDDGYGLKLRAVVYARLGKGLEAKADVAALKSRAQGESLDQIAETQVAILLGDSATALAAIDGAIDARPHDDERAAEGARAYALAASATGPDKSGDAERYAARAVELLRAATSSRLIDLSALVREAEFDGLRERPDFRDLVAAARPGLAYGAVWAGDTNFESRERHGASPDQHLKQARELADNGFRPIAVSVSHGLTGVDPAGPYAAVAASVWRRPLVAEEGKFNLAARQARAAAALCRLGAAGRAWPLLTLEHRPAFNGAADPTTRTEVIHRLALLGVDPEVLVDRLFSDKADPSHDPSMDSEASLRRGLLLALRQFSAVRLPAGRRKELIPRLLSLFRDDADPGIHSAAAALLLAWEATDEVDRASADLAALPRPAPVSSTTLLADAQANARQWYVNAQGQTFAIVPGPVEFDMGTSIYAPSGYGYGDERQHRRRIDRSFAIATHEVTLAQFCKFQESKQYEGGSQEPGMPVESITWYDAAAYCNWLSQEDGLPPEQWCYPPEAEIKDGMRMPADYLKRAGYRLPTEAEWEYACRAGSGTAWSFGDDRRWLPQYAWYSANSRDLSAAAQALRRAGEDAAGLTSAINILGDARNAARPVGRLLPNDLGLFDVHGNLCEWSQEDYRAYPIAERIVDDGSLAAVSENVPRALRGGDFVHGPHDSRAASRANYSPASRPANDSYNVAGFRPVRTYALPAISPSTPAQKLKGHDIKP